MLLLFFNANSGTIKFYQINSRDISHISPLFDDSNNFVSFCKKFHLTLIKPGLKPLIFSLNFKRVAFFNEKYLLNLKISFTNKFLNLHLMFLITPARASVF